MTMHPKALAVAAPRFSRETAKRILDIILSAYGLLLLLPAFAVIAVAIRVDDGGAAFYRQMRVGRGGRTFEIIKFRSMTPREPAGETRLTVAGDPRVAGLEPSCGARNSTNFRSWSTSCLATCPSSDPALRRPI